jgi:hypothetical protein
MSSTLTLFPVANGDMTLITLGNGQTILIDVNSPHDSRVNMPVLNARFGPLPTDESEQNSKFFEIYSQYRDAVPVLDAHKAYLAMRDIALISFLFTPTLSLLVSLLTGDGWRSFYYALCLLTVFLFFGL